MYRDPRARILARRRSLRRCNRTGRTGCSRRGRFGLQDPGGTVGARCGDGMRHRCLRGCRSVPPYLALRLRSRCSWLRPLPQNSSLWTSSSRSRSALVTPVAVRRGPGAELDGHDSSGSGLADHVVEEDVAGGGGIIPARARMIPSCTGACSAMAPSTSRGRRVRSAEAPLAAPHGRLRDRTRAPDCRSRPPPS